MKWVNKKHKKTKRMSFLRKTVDLVEKVTEWADFEPREDVKIDVDEFVPSS